MKPELLKPNLERIPDELKQLTQWVVWRAELRNNKWTKVPFDPLTHQKAKSNDSKTWRDFETAKKAFSDNDTYDGIGFALSSNDPYVGWDLDHCRDPETGKIEPWATEFINKLNSYTEISPSGTGIRIFVKGFKLPPQGRKKGTVEVYDSGRYLTVTGHRIEGTPDSIYERERESLELHESIFNGVKKTKQKLSLSTSSDDLTLLQKSFKRKSAEKWKRLLDGDFHNYPSQSEADLAFCSHLSKIFDGDRERINNIFKQSGLYRKKWDEKHFADGRTYGEETINKAISGSNKSPQGSNESASQYDFAQKVIDHFGKKNILHVDSFTWKWNGEGLWRKTDDREIKQTIQKIIPNKKITKSTVDSVLDLVKTEINRPNHRFDVNRESINCLNGELFWNGQEWELKAHCREHYRTTQIPVAYDQKANAPRFESFLDEIFIDDEDKPEKINLVHEAIGYSLLSACEHEKFFLLIGSGANGKTVLMDTVRALVGIENVSAVQPSQFENKFQRAHLNGKLVNIVTEIPEGHVIADAILKAIVSGELITAEHKHKPPFEFEPFCTCWFGTNHMPQTRDFSDAFFRRTIILEFNRTFAEYEQDLKLKHKIKQEMPGILNLALQGLGRLLKNGCFTKVDSCEMAKSEWRKYSDSVKEFTEELCIFGPGFKIPSGELYQRYASWETQGGMAKTVGKNSFSSQMKSLGAIPGRTTGGTRTMSGVTLRDRIHN